MGGATELIALVATCVGEISVCRVPHPHVSGPPPVGTVLYAAVLTAPSDPEIRPGVCMAVTVLDARALNDSQLDDLRTPGPRPPKWDGETSRVDNVYAIEQIRGSNLRDRYPNCESPAVLVGRELLARECFEAHSPERSVGGDRWATAVGGPIPEKTGEPVPSYKDHMKALIQRLNEESLW